MDQLLVVGRRTAVKDVLVGLQSLGVVQVEPLDPAGEEAETAVLRRLRLEGVDRRHKDAWDYLVARSEALLDALEVGDVKATPRSDLSQDPEELRSAFRQVGEQVDHLVGERADIRDELEISRTYLTIFRQLAPSMAQLEGATYLAGTALMVADEDYEAVRAGLEEELQGGVILAWQRYGHERMVVVAVLRKDVARVRSAISRLGHAELTLPERYADLGVAKAAHVMEERSQTLPKRISAIHEELRKLAAQHGPRLRALQQVARNNQSRFERMEDLLEGRYGFALRGWVPRSERGRVVDALRKQFGGAVVVDAREADEHHDSGVPVKLENAGWVRPFQGLLALFAPPKYGSFDPSWTLAVFFPLFFGIVVGDIGFGIMFALLAWWLRARGAAGKDLDLGPLSIVIPPRALGPLSTVIFWCSAWTMVFGFVYGEFFGNLLERFPGGSPVFFSAASVGENAAEHVTGVIPILLLRVEVFAPLLLLALGFGVLQVLGGWFIRIVFGLRHHDRAHVYEGVGMLSGLLALVVFASAYLSGVSSPVVTVVVVAGFAVFLVCAFLARMPLMLVEVVSNSGHILSYLRLFAVGLSAALIANLSTDLGYAIGGTLPILGPILGIVLGFAVHLIAISLTIIGHTLQPLRLQYVEFFTKFGFYDENGRPYQPFRLLGGKS